MDDDEDDEDHKSNMFHVSESLNSDNQKLTQNKRSNNANQNGYL